MSGKKKGKKIWEFDCPQFIDFAAGLDELSPVNDVWFGDLNGRKTAPPLKLTNEAFGPKMATPKLKPFKSLKNSPYINTERPINTDDEKLAMLGKLSKRESKSDCFLNRIDQKLMTPDQLPSAVSGPGHRRSLSDCGIIKTKKKLYPATPMCLKRVLNKGKNKKFKTTEELEMEQITKLQNELHEHLRLNEINLKRIKENRAPYVMHKLFDKKSKTKSKASNDHTIKGFEAAGEKLDDLGKMIGQSRLQSRKTASRKDYVRNFKSKAEELQAILNPQSKPTTRLNALRDINIVENGKNLKMVPLSKYAHSGVKFLPNEDKKTIPHPFSFDTSSTSFQNLSFNFKENDKFSASMRTPQLLINKENIHPVNRFHSESKMEKKVIRRNL